MARSNSPSFSSSSSSSPRIAKLRSATCISAVLMQVLLLCVPANSSSVIDLAGPLKHTDRHVFDYHNVTVNLMKIVLTNTSLTEFRSIYSAVKPLTRLRIILILDHRQIRFGARAFESLNLTTLLIKNVAVLRFDVDTFVGVHYINVLNLNKNRLASLSFELFRPLIGRLEKINLSGNRLVTLSSQWRVVFASMHILKLEDNPIQCDCRMRWLYRLMRDKRVAVFITCHAPAKLNATQFKQVAKLDWLACPLRIDSISIKLNERNTTGSSSGLSGVTGEPAACRDNNECADRGGRERGQERGRGIVQLGCGVKHNPHAESYSIKWFREVSDPVRKQIMASMPIAQKYFRFDADSPRNSPGTDVATADSHTHLFIDIDKLVAPKSGKLAFICQISNYVSKSTLKTAITMNSAEFMQKRDAFELTNHNDNNGVVGRTGSQAGVGAGDSGDVTQPHDSQLRFNLIQMICAALGTFIGTLIAFYFLYQLVYRKQKKRSFTATSYSASILQNSKLTDCAAAANNNFSQPMIMPTHTLQTTSLLSSAESQPILLQCHHSNNNNNLHINPTSQHSSLLNHHHYQHQTQPQPHHPQQQHHHHNHNHLAQNNGTTANQRVNGIHLPAGSATASHYNYRAECSRAAPTAIQTTPYLTIAGQITSLCSTPPPPLHTLTTLTTNNHNNNNNNTLNLHPKSVAAECGGYAGNNNAFFNTINSSGSSSNNEQYAYCYTTIDAQSSAPPPPALFAFASNGGQTAAASAAPINFTPSVSSSVNVAANS